MKNQLKTYKAAATKPKWLKTPIKAWAGCLARHNTLSSYSSLFLSPASQRFMVPEKIQGWRGVDDT